MRKIGLKETMMIVVVFFAIFSSPVMGGGSSPVLTKGQARGVLVDDKGHHFTNKYDVILGRVNDDETITINTNLQSRLDDSGAFLFKDLPPGKYAIYIFNKRSGSLGAVVKGEKVFIFDMPNDKGIDLAPIFAVPYSDNASSSTTTWFPCLFHLFREITVRPARIDVILNGA